MVMPRSHRESWLLHLSFSRCTTSCWLKPMSLRCLRNLFGIFLRLFVMYSTYKYATREDRRKNLPESASPVENQLLKAGEN